MLLSTCFWKWTVAYLQLLWWGRTNPKISSRRGSYWSNLSSNIGKLIKNRQALQQSCLFLFPLAFSPQHSSINEHMKAPKKEERSVFTRLCSLLFNPWFWDLVFKRVKYFFFPSLDKTVKLFSPALDATLIGLDGTTKYSLLNDFIAKTPADMPLIINIGSYNWGLFMAKLDKMAIIYDNFCSGDKPLARYLTIYIEECKRPYWFVRLLIFFQMSYFFHQFHLDKPYW